MENANQFFIAAWDTPLSSSPMTDSLIAITTLYVFMFPEGNRLDLPLWLLIVLAVLIFFTAFALTFSLFMFLKKEH